MDGTFADYMEIMVQFGLVTIFAIAFPLAPILAIISNVTEMQLDKHKILDLVQRPMPQGAKDIGSWSKVLEVSGNIALITNLSLLCFTLDTLDSYEHHK